MVTPILNKVFGILIDLMLYALPAFATFEEDVAESISLFESVRMQLKREFTRIGAPLEYVEAYRKLEDKDSEIRAEIAERPDQVGIILHSQLASLGLSHLKFTKLEKDHLGFETSPGSGGTVKSHLL